MCTGVKSLQLILLRDYASVNPYGSYSCEKMGGGGGNWSQGNNDFHYHVDAISASSWAFTQLQRRMASIPVIIGPDDVSEVSEPTDDQP
jgi:hypothetical protein